MKGMWLQKNKTLYHKGKKQVRPINNIVDIDYLHLVLGLLIVYDATNYRFIAWNESLQLLLLIFQVARMYSEWAGSQTNSPSTPSQWSPVHLSGGCWISFLLGTSSIPHAGPILLQIKLPEWFCTL